MAPRTSGEEADPPTRRRPSSRELLRRSFVSGVGLALPLLVTLAILSFALNFISGQLDPVVDVVQQATPNQQLQALLIEVTTLVVLIVLVFVVGFLAEFGPGDGQVGDGFDYVMESIPGVGSVYTSFNEMSELLLDSDTESFQEVKLVEYPREGSYTVAFKTATTPDVIGDATGHEEMVTLFMPMAPNPVMGGFVIHVSSDRVVDVDMTVEQGIRSIVTSGVAIGEGDPQMRGLTEAQMRELSEVQRVDNQVGGADSEGVGRDAGTAERRERYDENVSPEHSDTPTGIETRTDDDTVGGSMDDHDRPDEVTSEAVIGETSERTPAERAGRAPDRAEQTSEKPPAEMADRDPTRRDGTDVPPADAADGDTGADADVDPSGEADGSPDTES
jgi:uncharacterized membrane protein